MRRVRSAPVTSSAERTPTQSAMNLLALLVPVAAGRGESPDGGSGVLIIVLTIVAVIVVIGAIVTLIARRTRG